MITPYITLELNRGHETACASVQFLILVMTSAIVMEAQVHLSHQERGLLTGLEKKRMNTSKCNKSVCLPNGC